MPESDEVSGSSTTEVDCWPLRSYLELGALPTAVPWARWHARQVVWKWGLDGLTETIELLVSELVTNAVKARCMGVIPCEHAASPVFNTSETEIEITAFIRGWVSPLWPGASRRKHR